MSIQAGEFSGTLVKKGPTSVCQPYKRGMATREQKDRLEYGRILRWARAEGGISAEVFTGGIRPYLPGDPTSEDWVRTARRATVPCVRCGGTGTYQSFGQCYRCGGKGRQSQEDRRRNWGYDRLHGEGE